MVFVIPDVRIVAVVGASRNPEKWGHKVFKTLLERYPDLKVYPINPKAETILGRRAYPNLRALPEKPDLVITVVPPKITESIVKEAVDLGVKYIWMQPGSESEDAIAYAEKNNVKVFHHVCIVESSEKEEIKPYFKVIRCEE